jgi:acyl-CoA oxidase
MIFKDFKIPRKALLSKFISCSKDGVLSIHGDPKVAYSTMMLIRVMLLNLGWDLLLKSLIISVKYTSFRGQFQSIPNSLEERKIIDYQATRLKIAPYLAFGYANMFVGKKLFKMIRKMEVEIKENVFHTMKELHALGSALKAHYMQEVLDGFYAAREI